MSNNYFDLCEECKLIVPIDSNKEIDRLNALVESQAAEIAAMRAAVKELIDIIDDTDWPKGNYPKVALEKVERVCKL